MVDPLERMTRGQLIAELRKLGAERRRDTKLERLVHDLSTLLAGRGHEVTVLTSHPGPPSVDVEDGVTVVRRRRPPAPEPLRWYEPFIATVPGALRGVLGGPFEIGRAHV